MASSSVTSLQNRIQFSVDQTVKSLGNSLLGTSLDKHHVDSQRTLYNPKSATNEESASDSQTANNTNPSVVPCSANSNMIAKEQFGHILLDIGNSVLPFEKLASTPSTNDGLSDDVEIQIRSLGCELIQLAGKLLKLPQVAMATGCVIFQRFFYAKSLVRYPFDHVAMACIGLASKIEESPRRVRDIINVFHHIKQIRNGRTIQPMVLDQHYISLKNQVIKAERRVLKELGFCVHVKHPHKIIVMYLRWLEAGQNMELQQMSWNFMNDSLRTDVFVRYAPETIAAACIYLSARKLRVPLPKNPSWFDVLGVEEDDIKDCCYRIMCLYDRKKPNHEELERKVEELRRKMEETKKLRSTATSAIHTPSNSSPASRTGSPSNGQSTNHERDRDHRDKDSRDIKQAKRETREGYQMNANSFGGERRSGSGNSRHSSTHHDNRKSYQNRFQSISAGLGNGTAVAGNVIGAGVNDENSNDRNNMDSGRTYENRRGIDRDHRNRENLLKPNDADLDNFENAQDISRKHKKHKRSRSHSGGEDLHNRRDRKKGKQKKRGPADSPEDLSPSKKNKRHSREKSRYEDRGHHPDYYDRRLGSNQVERVANSSINNSRSDDNRGGCFAASDNSYYPEERRDRGGSGYNSANDQRNNGSYKDRDRDYYRR